MNTLSRRENEIFRMVVKGWALKDIASKLFISIKTVESHRTNINRKLGRPDDRRSRCASPRRRGSPSRRARAQVELERDVMSRKPRQPRRVDAALGDLTAPELAAGRVGSAGDFG